MAKYSSGSRFRKAEYGTFRNKSVVYAKTIDYSLFESVNTYTVTSGAEFRPDLVSVAVYGRPDLGWIIMAYNQFDHSNELTAGRTLKVPSAQGILNAL